MSVRETPKSNRYLDLKEKERAYKKHMEAVANAKPTIDTSTPDCPNRLKVKEKADAHYRRQLLTDYSKRERMIASAREGKKNNQDLFPDNYYPDDDDDIDFDELVKKYGGEAKKDGKEINAKEFVFDEKPEKSDYRTEKIQFGYDKDHEIQIEEEDIADILNDKIDYSVKKKKNKSKTPPQKPRTASKIPVSRKPPVSLKSKEEGSQKKKKDRIEKVEKVEKNDKNDKNEKSDKNDKISKDDKKPVEILNSSLDEKKLSSSAKKDALQNTASSTMTFGDDFEDDFENDKESSEEKDNFDDPDTESESIEGNKFEEEKNESASNSNSESEGNLEKILKNAEELIGQNSEENFDQTDPMQPIAKLAEDENKNEDEKESDPDEIPDLEFPNF